MTDAIVPLKEKYLFCFHPSCRFISILHNHSGKSYQAHGVSEAVEGFKKDIKSKVSLGQYLKIRELIEKWFGK